jgi:hypothetical protein
MSGFNFISLALTTEEGELDPPKGWDLIRLDVITGDAPNGGLPAVG